MCYEVAHADPAWVNAINSVLLATGADTLRHTPLNMGYIRCVLNCVLRGFAKQQNWVINAKGLQWMGGGSHQSHLLVGAGRVAGTDESLQGVYTQ